PAVRRSVALRPSRPLAMPPTAQQASKPSAKIGVAAAGGNAKAASSPARSRGRAPGRRTSLLLEQTAGAPVVSAIRFARLATTDRRIAATGYIAATTADCRIVGAGCVVRTA